MLKRLNPDFVLAFLVASVFWAVVLGWQASYAPSEKEKQECYETAKKIGHKTDECKSFWEKTTSEPVALFTLVLAFTTLGLWTATIGLYFAGRNAANETRRIGEAQVRAYVHIKAASVDFMHEFAGSPRVAFIASNSGQSPARNFVWNITLQYPAPQINRQSVFNPNWQSEIGYDIPANKDAPAEAALIPYMVTGNLGVRSTVVWLKIDYRFTDVFGQDWSDEAYFAGIMNYVPAAAEGLPPAHWRAEISQMPKPRGWDDIGRPNAGGSDQNRKNGNT